MGVSENEDQASARDEETAAREILELKKRNWVAPPALFAVRSAPLPPMTIRVHTRSDVLYAVTSHTDATGPDWVWVISAHSLAELDASTVASAIVAASPLTGRRAVVDAVSRTRVLLKSATSWQQLVTVDDKAARVECRRVGDVVVAIGIVPNAAFAIACPAESFPDALTSQSPSPQAVHVGA